jgi:hypothetical protein
VFATDPVTVELPEEPEPPEEPELREEPELPEEPEPPEEPALPDALPAVEPDTKADCGVATPDVEVW